MSRRRRRSGEPLALGEAIAEVGRDLGMPAPDAVGRLLASWSLIVGDAVAAHAHVRSLRDGELVVGVDGPGWATQLRYLESSIRDRADERVGAGVVQRVRVVVEAEETPDRHTRLVD